jgi:predicted GNAT family acetyltransferase
LARLSPKPFAAIKEFSKAHFEHPHLAESPKKSGIEQGLMNEALNLAQRMQQAINLDEKSCEDNGTATSPSHMENQHAQMVAFKSTFDNKVIYLMIYFK